MRTFRWKTDGHVIKTNKKGADLYQELYGYEYDQMHGTVNSLGESSWEEILENGEVIPLKAEGLSIPDRISEEESPVKNISIDDLRAEYTIKVMTKWRNHLGADEITKIIERELKKKDLEPQLTEVRVERNHWWNRTCGECDTFDSCYPLGQPNVPKNYRVAGRKEKACSHIKFKEE